MKTAQIPTVEALAMEFAKVLLEDIGAPSLRMASLLNLREPDKDVCHTHDFCDSNQSMIDAYARLTGIPAAEVDVCTDPFVTVANAAWSLAKSKVFFLDTFGMVPNLPRPVGVHTPSYTAKILQSLREAFPRLTFIDTSWNNDATDSIEIEDVKYDALCGDERGTIKANRYRIWIPDTQEGEDYCDFILDDMEKEQNASQYLPEAFPTFEALVERLKQIEA